ncbi:uncharacterized protein LOC110846888 isoform X2 [Folsomia candida]|uniref:uncharacterized protein LOC110846888 isoform X2 n=1 Tax=Folsomia candida TaxID=158441 RepID=UPI001604E9C7|nr:uncharacterized protein LOC110846888 isoform X2 [Folsomia candida]
MKFVTLRLKRRRTAPFYIFIASFVLLCVILVTIHNNQHENGDIISVSRSAGQSEPDDRLNFEYSISLEATDVDRLDKINETSNSIHDLDGQLVSRVMDESTPISEEKIDQEIQTETYVTSVEENLLPELKDDVISNVETEEPENNHKTEFQNFLQESLSTLLAAIGNTIRPISKEDALAKQRDRIQRSLQNYSRDEAGEEFNLSRYQIQEGGSPIRNVIFTTWRSGSTFLGEAISSYPSMFYHYEPLLHFEIVQARSSPLADEGLRVIRQLLDCNYTDLRDYINYGKRHINLHTHNFRLWRHCKNNPELLCGDPDFLSRMCQMFPFQIMKTVRMRLRYAESLLQDPKLDVRILFLVRDPRGTLNSRKKMVRYEDISMNPFSGMKRVLNFFRLKYHPHVDAYIRTHTTNTMGGVSSTFRHSKSTPFQWIKYFADGNNTEELEHVEEQCGKAMQLWGYAPLDLDTSNNATESMILLKAPWPEMVLAPDDELNTSENHQVSPER